MRKGKDPFPYSWLTDPDADPGGPKTYGSYGFGSGTLLFRDLFSLVKHKYVMNKTRRR
jgi:hypothetical protein